MTSDSAFEQLKERFSTSSWAVWGEDDMSDTSVIEAHRDRLHSRVVLVALNPSGPIDRPWGNFHSPSPGDRKLRRLFNRSSYRGAYMTDLIKDHIAPDASSVEDIDAEVMHRNVQVFRDEMDVLGADASTLFVLFGRQARWLFCEHLSFFYRNAVMCTHYAYYGATADVWVKEARQTLTEHWKRTQRIDSQDGVAELNTPEFVPYL